jgi:hypothetical protein
LNIYSQKQRWKLLLFAAALIIVGLSLWYTNTLVNKIAEDESKKVKLWADAIRKKAKLVQYTNELFTKITNEERKKVELWANGTRQLANPSLQMEDVSFIFEVIKNNETVPVVLADDKGKVISSRNLDSAKSNDKEYLAQQMEIMRKQHEPIEITILKGHRNYLYYKDSKLFSELKNVLEDLVKSFISEVAINSASVPVIFTDSTRSRIIAYGNIDSAKISSPKSVQAAITEMESAKPPIVIDFGDEGKQYIFYKDSFLLTQLKYYPYVQFGVIGLFLLIAYTLFSTARNAEQNQVWVGMAKETAHQLGTPLSSLMAWVEYLKTKNVPPETISELEKDVKRLETITERFSKIGSAPKLQKENIYNVMEEAVNYLKTRTSKNVIYSIKSHDGNQVVAQLNIALFAWVIENLCRNAVDAMDGNGAINVDIYDQTQYVYIDITDTGKGLPKSKYKTIFKPGFTTKQRGWGLGLSLSKRIIENYHAGEIFVKWSELNKGTTFRIVLNK